MYLQVIQGETFINRKASISCFCRSPCEGYFSLKMKHFHPRCTAEEVEVESHHGDQGTQRAGSGEAVAPSLGLSGRSRCPVVLGCVPSAARPSSFAPWPLAGSGHRNRLARPWRRPRYGDLSPGP